MGPSCLSGRTWGDGWIFWGWRLKFLGMMVQRLVGRQIQRGRHELRPFLAGCPEAIMMYDMCRSLITFFLKSKHYFVFRALPLYISHSSFLISPFSAETHCQSATIILVREWSVHSQIWWVFSFHKSVLPANILFIFLDFIHTRHHF